MLIVKRLFHPSTPKNNILSTIMNGTGLSSTTHSKQIARGKYVHEVVFHHIKPECVPSYNKLINKHFPSVPSHGVHHVGSWQSIIGELDLAVHVWEYKGYEGYHAANGSLAKSKEHQDFLKELAPLLRSRENQICLEFAFWETISPTTKINGGLYELRSYALKPGHLLEWANHWKKGLHSRRKFCTPIGAWFSQLGDLHQVHHMWVYPDLHSRKLSREAAWEIPGWSDAVEKTVPLVTTMKAQILEPFECSPLK